MMKRIVSMVAVGLLVGAGIWGYSYARSRGGAPTYRLTRVDRGPVTSTVSATGNLNAVITVQVGSQVSGQIKELLADIRAILVHAISEEAKRFYERHGFVASPVDPMTLMITVADAKNALGRR